ncbi:hypothetical protein [Actinacidiphila sp. ITFR-21]|uniref:hypothetical protein n=1 Tax=Actinacidiphila sp. ITFR-21 TaxID=3075199 RepID=UPI0028890280|nr:hypothetical protein [Streptomyces sp. ITFR-21]WNI16729.1 hypothetical protein RLT57_15205 [Streptomyces sp. ITFR-21]
MVVSVSAVLLLFALTVTFMRHRSLKPGHALTCVLLGFLLASSSLAPSIRSTVVSTADLVSTLRP